MHGLAAGSPGWLGSTPRFIYSSTQVLSSRLKCDSAAIRILLQASNTLHPEHTLLICARKIDGVGGLSGLSFTARL